MKSMFTAIAAALVLSACTFTVGSGEKTYTLGVGTKSDYTNSNYVTQNIDLKNFDTLECSIPADIIYETGDPKVVIVTTERIMSHIIVSQEGEKLIIKSDDKRVRGIKDAKIYVTSRQLNVLTLNGAVEFESRSGIFNNGDFTLLANGASDVEIRALKSDNVKILCNGAADIELDGLECDEITVTVNGAADVDLEGYTGLADLTINGAGDINIARLHADKVISAVRGIGAISRTFDD